MASTTFNATIPAPVQIQYLPVKSQDPNPKGVKYFTLDAGPKSRDEAFELINRISSDGSNLSELGRLLRSSWTESSCPLTIILDPNATKNRDSRQQFGSSMLSLYNKIEAVGDDMHIIASMYWWKEVEFTRAGRRW